MNKFWLVGAWSCQQSLPSDSEIQSVEEVDSFQQLLAKKKYLNKVQNVEFQMFGGHLASQETIVVRNSETARVLASPKLCAGPGTLSSMRNLQVLDLGACEILGVRDPLPVLLSLPPSLKELYIGLLKKFALF